MKNKTKWIKFLTLVVMIAVLLVGCGKQETAAPAKPAAAATTADTVLITEAFHSLLYLPLYVARDTGFF